MKNWWEWLNGKYCEENILEFLTLGKEEVKEIIYNNGKIACLENEILFYFKSRYIFLSALLIPKRPLYIICNFYNILGEHDLILFAELAFTMKVDNKTDVYSFSVVTLEVIMGRHPGELITSLLSSAS